MRKSILTASLASYAALLLFISWWPFNFNFAHASLGSVEWPPFQLLSPVHWKGGKEQVLKIVTFVPLGALLAITAKAALSGVSVVTRSALIGAVFSLLIQLGWFFLPGRFVSASGVALCAAGALAGALPVYFHHLNRGTLRLMTVAYGLCFLVAATWPWHFSLEAASSAQLQHRIEWRVLNTRVAMWVLKESALNTLITVPLGLLAASWILRENTSRRALAAAIAWGGGCSLLVEILQCFLRTRTPSVADFTLNTAGAVAGAGVAYYLDRWHRRHPEPKPPTTGS